MVEGIRGCVKLKHVFNVAPVKYQRCDGRRVKKDGDELKDELVCGILGGSQPKAWHP